MSFEGAAATDALPPPQAAASGAGGSSTAAAASGGGSGGGEAGGEANEVLESMRDEGETDAVEAEPADPEGDQGITVAEAAAAPFDEDGPGSRERATSMEV